MYGDIQTGVRITIAFCLQKKNIKITRKNNMLIIIITIITAIIIIIVTYQNRLEL